MKKSLLSLCAAVLIALPSMAGAEMYYVELGRASSEQQASNVWENVKKSQKALVGDLEFFPNSVLLPSGDLAVRVQAGPLGNKDEAQTLCKKLFKRNQECFVIEGFNPAAPRTFGGVEMADLTPAPTSAPPTPASSVSVGGGLPWDNALMSSSQSAPVTLAQASDDNPPAAALDVPPAAVAVDKIATPPEPPAPVAEISPPPPAEVRSAPPPPVALPESKAEPKIVAAAPPPPAPKAKVEVAEAIRVPLSKDAETVGRIESRELQPLASARSGSFNIISDNVGGWLNVGAFSSAGEANAFWQDVQSASAGASADLRMQIYKPGVSKANRTRIHIGPFASDADAYDFCRTTILPMNRGVECGFDLLTSDAIATAEKATQDRSDRYRNRRDSLLGRHSADSSESIPVQRLASNVYWVQVAQAANEAAANAKLDQLRTAHADLLSNLKSRISTTLNRKGSYSVRVGPFGSQAEADRLCNQLLNRGVACRAAGNP